MIKSECVSYICCIAKRETGNSLNFLFQTRKDNLAVKLYKKNYAILVIGR